MIDYRNQFWLKSNHKEANFDLQLLASEFKKSGYIVDIRQFSHLDLKNIDYSNTFVVYQSAEDPDSFYKSYIEDCLLGIEMKGAILIPSFHYFRAHNNKVFMEILRDVNLNKELKFPLSKYYGTYEEYRNCLNIEQPLDGEKVFKLSEGAQSKNVLLLKSINDFKNIPKKKSSTFNFYYWFVDQIKPFLKKRYSNYKKKSHHRKKFILQDFVSNLSGDFKVLAYGNKYFVLSRKVRSNDFRASGSGLFSFNKELPMGLLDYARRCYESFNVPFMELDIAEKNCRFYLIEFQFVNFGNYTLEKSPFHFSINNNRWELVDGKVILEEEFASSINSFIKKI